MRKSGRVQPPVVKLPWHDRKLPDDWDADDVAFFRNWMKELEASHRTLLSVAGDRLKVLRRVRRIWFKLAFRLTEQIRETATQAKAGDAIVGVGPGDDGLFQRFQILVWPDLRKRPNVTVSSVYHSHPWLIRFQYPFDCNA
jgi:hypothetical protein